MAKTKYKFNPDSLSYDRIVTSFKSKLIKFLTYFMASIAVSVLYYAFLSNFFSSPKEKKLMNENAQLRLEYEVLNRNMDNVNTQLSGLQQKDDNIYRTIFEADPIPSTQREAGFGGSNRYSDLEGFEFSNLMIKTAEKLDKISTKIKVQGKSYDEVIKLAKRKEEMLASIPAIQPISNKDLTNAASGWGWRIHPVYKIKKFHEGIDFSAPTGSDIYATGDGVIEELEVSYRGYGWKIVINHGFGYHTLYGHCSGFNVVKGQKVKRGDVIGYVGCTGLSTAPHVHYEVKKGNEKVNPINYFFNDLSAEEYEKLIELSTNSNKTFD
jgi:murein DD-endopeptidase MepM/ murein hydrolase activator NlpD